MCQCVRAPEMPLHTADYVTNSRFTCKYIFHCLDSDSVYTFYLKYKALLTLTH